MGNKIRFDCLTYAFLEAEKGVEMVCHPYILGGPQRRAWGHKSEVVPNKGQHNEKWLLQPSKGCKRELKCYATSAFLVVLNTKRGPQYQKWSTSKGKKFRSGSLTPAYSGKRVEMVCHFCILRVCNAKGGEQNQKWPPRLCILGDLKEGRTATLRLSSRRSPTPWAVNKIKGGYPQPLPSWGFKRERKHYVTPAFTGVSKAKRGEQKQKWSPTKGKEIMSGRLTPTFSEAQKG